MMETLLKLVGYGAPATSQLNNDKFKGDGWNTITNNI